MVRNIADVVHDLKPIVGYLHKKALNLLNAEDPKKLMELIERIQHDAVMLERYLKALDQDAKTAGIQKNEASKPE